MYINRLHPFEHRGIYFFYDSETGVVSKSEQIVNKIIVKINEGYDRKSVIQLLESEKTDYLNNNQDIESIYSELDGYINNRFSISDEYKKNLVRIGKIIQKEDWYQGKVLQSMWLSIAHSCNLKCSYCYAKDGTYGNKAMMSKETAKECIDFFFRYLKKDSQKFSVNFFGGEPLLNKEVFIYALDYINVMAKEAGKCVNYIMTTNGTVLDEEILKAIVENNIVLNISIDGSRQTHNINRKFSNGDGSFDVVERNIKKILEVYDNIVARVTLTKPGIKYFKDDIIYLWNLGLTCIYIEPVITGNKELELDEASLEAFEKQLEVIVDIMEKETNIKHNTKMISNIIFTENRISNRTVQEVCKYFNASTTMFTPEGDIYTCNKIFGNKEHCAGNIKQGITWEKYQRTYTANKKCLDCWAKRICGGLCDVMERSDLICKYQKSLIKQSLKFYVNSKFDFMG